MSDPETPNQPLLGASNHQTAVNVGAPGQGPRPSRAYKVAGLTLLACVLIAGQAMIAYFLLSQRSDIRSLEEQNNQLNMQMTNGQSASMPVRMHMPMNALPKMMDITMEEEASTAGQGKTAAPLTTCQEEAAGLKPLQVPGFRPRCDKQGLYWPQQCFMGQCWCVNPVNGDQIPGTLTQGLVRCATPVLSGRLLAMADVDD